MKSMTGYGRAKQELHGRTITAELRAVNHRYLDCTVKAPRQYGFLDDAVKKAAAARIARGKVEVYINVETQEGGDIAVTVNHALAEHYLAALHELADKYGLRDDVSVMSLAKLPDVLGSERIEQDADTRRWLLKKGVDAGKDQSYVLYTMTQRQLAHTKFPLGDRNKPEIRDLAEQLSFCNARKHDSQDICFVPDGDYVKFMEQYTGKHYPAGDFLDLDGNPVGKHKGAVRYTVGQRRGLGLAMGEPVYVCGKDMEKNTVSVGPEAALFSDTVIVDDMNWISIPELTEPIHIKAKIRYRHPEQPVTVSPMEDGKVKLVFDEPQRAAAIGQAAVLYDGDVVVGGGTIVDVPKQAGK